MSQRITWSWQIVDVVYLKRSLEVQNLVHNSHLLQRYGLFYHKNFTWFLTIVSGVLLYFKHFLKNNFEKSDQLCDRNTIKDVSHTILGDHMVFPTEVPCIMKWNSGNSLAHRIVVVIYRRCHQGPVIITLRSLQLPLACHTGKCNPAIQPPAADYSLWSV